MMWILSKNNLFFAFLLFGYVFGVILYDFIAFKYTDELMVAFLALFVGMIVWERRNLRELIPILVVSGIFLFYIFYSFLIQSNTFIAILKDAIIQVKPYLGFFCVLLLRPKLGKEQKLVLSILSLLVAGLLLIIALVDPYWIFFGHPSRFATAVTVTAFLFFYCSSYTWGDILIFICILSIGFFSTRSKFYGFWALTFLMVVYYKLNRGLNLNWKTILFGVVALLVVLFLSWNKIVTYYIDGAMNSREMWSRPAMFLTSYHIFIDYFPFGSGLGSFGTFVSGESYSAIYAKYGIDTLWGLSKGNPMFITDAFYPSLAQFGVVGVLLYIFFWTLVLKMKGKPVGDSSLKMRLIVLLIAFFFLIEGIADATFTHNRGLYMLIILALAK